LVARSWNGLIWLRIGTGGCLLARGNEPSDFIKCGEFLDWLRNYYIFKKDCATWGYLFLSSCHLLKKGSVARN
jgi:hypothetical protein